jgi:hypothetical protein
LSDINHTTKEGKRKRGKNITMTHPHCLQIRNVDYFSGKKKNSHQKTKKSPGTRAQGCGALVPVVPGFPSKNAAPSLLTLPHVFFFKKRI